MYLNFNASVPVEDSVLTEAMARGREKKKEYKNELLPQDRNSILWDALLDKWNRTI